ncbi:MAG TPA: hypothetical protein VFL80_13130 [Thermoanaerobaculia bacterium]|nr:hypothetical protein [Thermoanaerobaculia bacterium]
MKSIVLALLLFPAVAFAERSLYWDEVAIRARLDDKGALRVREQQAYVFNGDWNGGERRFRVERGQGFQLESVSRVAADGTLVPLQYGSLDAVDGYQMVGDHTLRWRSRLPTDPPFRDTRITYLIEYTLSNILLQRGSEFLLDHDFGFPDRSGDIKRLTLDLELDPAWRAIDVPKRLDLGPLPPGAEAIVRGRLIHSGGGVVARPDTRPFRFSLMAVLILVPVLLARLAFRREKGLGRFAPLETSSVTRDWIERNLLPVRAEVIGAAWDESVSDSEVAALLARWSAEGKVTTSAQSGEEMVMRLKVSRDEFTEPYERELIDKLFFAGEQTSTTAIRAHYKSSGLSPSTIISRGVYEKAEELTRKSEPAPKIWKLPTLLLFLATVALFMKAFPAVEEGREMPAAVGVFFSGVFWFWAAFAAMVWRGRVDYGLRQAVWFIVPLCIVAAIALTIIALDLYDATMYLAFMAGVIMISNNTFNNAKSKRGRTAIAYRKRLASVRQYFMTQLREKTPLLDDRWFPYVIAFGLNDQANAWLRDFGGERSTVGATTSRTSTSSSSSSSSSSGWTGGGGAFGGAGATGSWAAAATGLAAGVASPSSSSSGGGGGSSSSSGGGGGGGW